MSIGLFLIDAMQFASWPEKSEAHLLTLSRPSIAMVVKAHMPGTRPGMSPLR